MLYKIASCNTSAPEGIIINIDPTHISPNKIGSYTWYYCAVDLKTRKSVPGSEIKNHIHVFHMSHFCKFDLQEDFDAL